MAAVSALVESLLMKRGVTEKSAVEAFLRPDFAAHTHDAALLSGMNKALERTLAALERNERIAIYADFDCDGIPGAVLLSDVFAKLGHGEIEVYLPHRDKEGYGFHAAAVAELGSRGVKLIITIDVGGSAHEAVRAASARGIDVIVTDHHELPSEMPEALAILNPKIAPYPFPDLCGAAVAFKFAQALLREGRARGIEAFLKVSDGWEKWLLDMVAIATVADMVPLVGENRALAFWGLQVLRKSPRPGVRALCEKLRLRQGSLTEDDIAFSIAPRINAASRMDEPSLALRLLSTRDARESQALAAQLESLNAKRKTQVGGIVREAKRRAKDRFSESDRAVVLGNPEWKPALLGLAANSLMDGRGGIVCLWGRDALGRIKGSCRSDGSVSVVDVFAKSGIFEESGGHKASGGFTLAHERVHTLQEDLAAAVAALGTTAHDSEEMPDALLSLRETTEALLMDIARLAPFGVGNPKPLLRISEARIKAVRRFGKEGNHVELHLVCSRSGAEMRAYDFFRAPEDFTCTPQADTAAAILCHLERDTFRGSLALRLIDVLPA